MKVLQLYNERRNIGGEEHAVGIVCRILERHGHQTSILMRSSRGIESSRLRKITAAFSGIFNPFAYHSLRRQLQAEHYDIVHAHSVYPRFSPSVLMACRHEQVPVILHVHSYMLTCPNLYHLRKGKVCELCFGGRSYWCLLTNCRGSLPESAAYTIRSAVAQTFKLFTNNVTLFVSVSRFLGDRLIAAGFPGEKIEVLPNAILSDDSQDFIPENAGGYVGYSGRLSFEKGVDILIEAARDCGLPVKIAGDGPERAKLTEIAPTNVEFLGHLNGPELRAFYRGSRFTVVPSRWFEGFPLSVVEAMMYGKPVIASNIGALPELVQSGLNGLLAEVDNVGQFADNMVRLWRDKERCESYGAAAMQWARAICSEEVYYDRLMSIYERASKLAG